MYRQKSQKGVQSTPSCAYVTTLEIIPWFYFVFVGYQRIILSFFFREIENTYANVAAAPNQFKSRRFKTLREQISKAHLSIPREWSKSSIQMVGWTASRDLHSNRFDGSDSFDLWTLVPERRIVRLGAGVGACKWFFVSVSQGWRKNKRFWRIEGRCNALDGRFQ